jgi:hypothetical protein
MAHPGPSGGSTPRTLRGISLAKGTAGAGFTQRAEYDTLGGHPVTPTSPSTVYKDSGVHVTTAGPTPINKKSSLK